MPDDEKPTTKKGELTEARTRAELAEERLREAKEEAAEAKQLLKNEERDDKATLEKWKAIREFVTGPNLKWLMAMVVIISLVGASIFSGKVFTVSQGGIVFGAGDAPPTGDILEDDALLPSVGPAAPDPAHEAGPAKPIVITREVVVEKIVEIPIPAPTPVPAPTRAAQEPTPHATRPPAAPATPPAAIAEPATPAPAPEPVPVPEPEPAVPPEPEPPPAPAE